MGEILLLKEAVCPSHHCITTQRINLLLLTKCCPFPPKVATVADLGQITMTCAKSMEASVLAR